MFERFPAHAALQSDLVRLVLASFCCGHYAKVVADFILVFEQDIVFWTSDLSKVDHSVSLHVLIPLELHLAVGARDLLSHQIASF